MNHFKTIIALFVLLCAAQQNYAQNFEIKIIEDFEDGLPSYFGLNSNGGSGLNMWEVSNSYKGFGVYPNTTSQDSTEGGVGQIGSPNGNYLHIRNVTDTVFNANYDPLLASQRWAVMDTGFCTFGFTEIVLNFWWLAVGSPGDFGEVYFSIDGGLTWILTTNSVSGLTKYNGKNKWNFARVSDTLMIDVPDLRFAFKWTNDGVNTNDSIPFAIDDVMIVAEYEDFDASTIVALNLFPARFVMKI